MKQHGLTVLLFTCIVHYLYREYLCTLQLDAPEKMAWTLPYVVLVNHEPPYGLAASHPRFYDGTKTEDGRLSWYSNSAVKDIILSFAVRIKLGIHTCLIFPTPYCTCY